MTRDLQPRASTAPIVDGRPVPVLWNVASGPPGAEDRIRDAAARAGITIDLQRLEPGALTAAIRGAVEAGTPILAVAGGDGSISASAQCLVGTATVLAVFPAGTKNHFARALGVDDHQRAAHALASRSVAAVDVGEVNGRVFLNGVSFGLYPRMLRLRRDSEPRLGRRMAAAFAAWRAVAEFPTGPLWWHDSDDPGSRYPLAWVGAGRGSFRLPRLQPRELDSGVLELVVVATWERTKLLRLAFATLRRGLDGVYACSEFPWCTVRYATEIIPTEPLPPWIDAGIDGELVRLHPPLRFRIRPGVLRVISARLTG